MLSAFIDVVAENGYENTTVRQIVARARVSFSAFSEAFDDKAQCFLAACERSADEVLRELYDAATEPTWIKALRVGTQTYLGWWDEHPSLARAYFIELPKAGSQIEERGRNYEGFRTMFQAIGERARDEEPELAPLKPIIPAAIVHAVSNIVGDHVRRHAALAPLFDDLLYLQVKLLADEATARNAIENDAEDLESESA
jgi:AcrR family transcriptional regulator